MKGRIWLLSVAQYPASYHRIVTVWALSEKVQPVYNRSHAAYISSGVDFCVAMCMYPGTQMFLESLKR